MSKYVRTLQVSAAPASYVGEDSTRIVYDYQESSVSQYPLVGVGPILLALLAIGILVIFRPQVETDQVQSPTEASIVASEDVGAMKSAVEVTALEVETVPVELAASVGISPLFTPEVQYWSSEILKWSQMYEVDPNVVATIMQIESCGDPRAASHAGAQGLFQVMPFHFAPGEDMLDPDTNAMRGLAFYKEQMRYTGGDRALSFAGYNGGYAASGGSYEYWPSETQRYFYWAKGIYDSASSGASSSATLDEWLAAGGAGGCQRAAAYLGL